MNTESRIYWYCNVIPAFFLRLALNICSMMTNHFENQKKVISYEKTVTADKNWLLKPRCLFAAYIFLLSLLNGSMWQDDQTVRNGQRIVTFH